MQFGGTLFALDVPSSFASFPLWLQVAPSCCFLWVLPLACLIDVLYYVLWRGAAVPGFAPGGPFVATASLAEALSPRADLDS